MPCWHSRTPCMLSLLFCCRATAPTEIYTLSLHDALPISPGPGRPGRRGGPRDRRHSDRSDCRRCGVVAQKPRSEEHTSELQSLRHLVCRLLLEKKKLHMSYPVVTKNKKITGTQSPPKAPT